MELRLSDVLNMLLELSLLLGFPSLSGVLLSITVDDIGSSGNQSCSSSLILDAPPVSDWKEPTSLFSLSSLDGQVALSLVLVLGRFITVPFSRRIL